MNPGAPHLRDPGDEVGDVTRGRPDDGHALALAEVARDAQLLNLRSVRTRGRSTAADGPENGVRPRIYKHTRCTLLG